jgi:hypothetical protein
MSKGPVQSGDRSSISRISRYSLPGTIPRPERAHFSYGAAADECSILGIIAAAFTALKYPETVCRPAKNRIRSSNSNVKDTLLRGLNRTLLRRKEAFRVKRCECVVLSGRSLDGEH